MRFRINSNFSYDNVSNKSKQTSVLTSCRVVRKNWLKKEIHSFCVLFLSTVE
jgi:hypothetical protein